MRFERHAFSNKLRVISSGVSFDSPRLQLIESKLVRNIREKQCCLSPSSCDVEEGRSGLPLARKQGNRECQNLDIETIKDGDGRGEPCNEFLIGRPATAIKQQSNIHKMTMPKVPHGVAPVLEAKAAFYSCALLTLRPVRWLMDA